MSKSAAQIELDKLIAFFQSPEGDELGRAGDYDNLSPADTAIRAIRGLGPAPRGPLTLDTPASVFFYEQDHYYLSNFSAFGVFWKGRLFPTSEHVYHYEKFNLSEMHQWAIFSAKSAHEAFKYAERHKAHRRLDWDGVKVSFMKAILRSKAEQHEYVRRKLLQTGDRELIENSWRDPYWGWGPDRNGKNMLGRTWMEVRAELRAQEPA